NAHESARANRQWHSRLPQTRYRRRHRALHRIHRLLQIKKKRREFGYICWVCKISDPQVLLAAIGLIFIAVLMARRISSAILAGILAITIAGIPLGLAHWPSHLFSLPHPTGTLLKLDLRSAAKLGLGDLIFVFFFVDLFDNVGTLVGVCEEGGFLVDGKLPRASRALLADAFGTIFGALTGTSTVTSYIESAAGVAAGARTGLGNVVIAGFFVVAMFCAPLVAAIPG